MSSSRLLTAQLRRKQQYVCAGYVGDEAAVKSAEPDRKVNQRAPGSSDLPTSRRDLLGSRRRSRPGPLLVHDLVIDIDNTPGALAELAAAISDAGVNIAAATCVGSAERAELHILVPHAEAVRHALGISHLGVSREHEVAVVDVADHPGVLADVTRKVAEAGVNLDLVYVATGNRLVLGASDMDALRAALA